MEALLWNFLGRNSLNLCWGKRLCRVRASKHNYEFKPNERSEGSEYLLRVQYFWQKKNESIDRKTVLTPLSVPVFACKLTVSLNFQAGTLWYSCKSWQSKWPYPTNEPSTLHQRSLASANKTCINIKIVSFKEGSALPYEILTMKRFHLYVFQSVNRYVFVEVFLLFFYELYSMTHNISLC